MTKELESCTFHVALYSSEMPWSQHLPLSTWRGTLETQLSKIKNESAVLGYDLVLVEYTLPPQIQVFEARKSVLFLKEPKYYSWCRFAVSCELQPFEKSSATSLS